MIGKAGMTLLAVAFVIVSVSSPPALGQSPADAQNKLLAKRAAEADCYRKLAETVYGVKITSDTYVRDFVTESDEIKSRVDTFVKGIKLGRPRYYEDGVCEVDAEVTVAKLITTLKEIHTQHYRGRRVTTTDIEEIKTRIQKDVIRVTGSGAPRPDLPPDLPPGVEELIEPLPSNYAPTMLSVPPIWKTVSGQGRLMAFRAARVEAFRQLLERIKGLRLTSDTLVRDFVAEYDEIAANAEGIVLGASEVRRYLCSDELIAEVTLQVPVERVVTKLKELHTQHYKGRRVVTTDIEEIKKHIERQYIEATGSGVPPARYMAVTADAGYVMPDWITFPVKAIGEGTDPAIETAQGKLKAARAAHLDALRKLAEQIYGLRISSTTSVRDFVTEYDDIATQVDAVLSGAVASDPTFQGGIARVEVTILGADVWRVVHQQMLIVKRRG